MTKTLLTLLLLCSSYKILASTELPLYFWDARQTQGFANFGDALSEALIERMIGHKITIVESPYNEEKNYWEWVQF